jgi:hypothetical protein
MTRNNDAFPVFSIVYNILAIPYNFLMGFVVGLAAPVAATAGIVAGIRLLTGKVPFLSQGQDEVGERFLTLRLVPAEEAGDLYYAEKDRISEELGDFQAEIRAIIEEARGEIAEAAPEDIEIVAEE